MIKAGIYKSPSCNQRTFCIGVNPPDIIKTWFEEPDDKPQDPWWNVSITPQKFHWLVDEWNNGHIAEFYPHWWEKVDSRKEHINSLLQLSMEELEEALNYFCAVVPHYRWETELHLDDELRPVFCRGKIIRWEEVSKEDAIAHNQQERASKKYSTDKELYGKTDSEYIREARR